MPTAIHSHARSKEWKDGLALHWDIMLIAQNEGGRARDITQGNREGSRFLLPFPPLSHFTASFLFFFCFSFSFTSPRLGRIPPDLHRSRRHGFRASSSAGKESGYFTESLPPSAAPRRFFLSVRSSGIPSNARSR